jgi:hypothetical protein
MNNIKRYGFWKDFINIEPCECNINEAQDGEYVLYEDAEKIIKENKILLELVDGATEIVELFKTKSQAQIKWKKDWLKKSRKIIKEYLIKEYEEKQRENKK